ncbi:MAG: prepilin-type N-terminal cleavage/methylation domain-containing protein [Candidatus Omnitrophica bacterium]|nr:prepilin-type N-terminal cleavage/methylation domain-containing protein [Candidatus Omnitrophota bacterium]
MTETPSLRGVPGLDCDDEAIFVSPSSQTATTFTLHAAKGFTFIEILMAVSLLAVGMVGVLRAYSTSVNAMEIAQYNTDAACLLKAVMGSVEEDYISQRDMPVGRSEEVYSSSSGIKMDTTRSGRWQWDKEVLATGLQAVKVVGPVTALDDNPETIVIYSLNEVKVTVVNPGRSPARRVNAVTYMESYPEDDSV